jgi:hypothetical protein
MRFIAWLFSFLEFAMGDLLSEERMTLSELARQEGVNVCTCFRWIQRGIRGVRLESFNRGGRRFTTREGFARWVAATQLEPSAPAPQGRTSPERIAAICRAEADLAKAGV